MAAALQLLLFLGLPALLLFVSARTRLGLWLSPVMLAYAAGVLVGNLAPPLVPTITVSAIAGAVLLGIPLLLFPADFLAWLRLAPSSALATGVAFLSLSLVTLASAPLFAPRADEGWIVAGLLVATYTGSTPNMAAIASGLGAKGETLTLVITTDLVAAGSLAFFLLSPGVRWLGRLLRPFRAADSPGDEVAPPAPEPLSARLLAPLGLALLVAGAAAGLATWLGTGDDQVNLIAIVAVTALGNLLSLSPAVRRLPGSWTLGEYFILVFCVAFGTKADLRALLAGSSGVVLAWTAVVVLSGLALHLLACRLLGIDRDTALISVSAAIYGPPFIGPIASSLGNKRLVLSGITGALAGLAVGTWLGLAVAWAVRAMVGS